MYNVIYEYIPRLTHVKVNNWFFCTETNTELTKIRELQLSNKITIKYQKRKQIQQISFTNSP